MAEVLVGVDVASALKVLDTEEFLEQKDKEMLLNMFQVFEERLREGSENLTLPITVLGTEKAISMNINDWKWYIKADLTFIETMSAWIGEYKTTSGYGPATAAFYHNSPQTFVYQRVAKHHIPELIGTKFFILTKTKEPRCEIESVYIVSDKTKIAEIMMDDTISFVEKIENDGAYERQGTQCKTLRSECEYLPLCYVWDPILNTPEKGVSHLYTKEVLQMYTHKDPDDHLGIEGDE